MTHLKRKIEKAKRSAFSLWRLNVSLADSIPFNKPHGIKIVEIYSDGVKVKLPLRRSNLNNINSIHTCALAALAEFASGFTLMIHFSQRHYRIIMQNMTITYHYRSKTDVFTICRLEEGSMLKDILVKLGKDGEATKEMQLDLFDEMDKPICTAVVNWQIKKWSRNGDMYGTE